MQRRTDSDLVDWLFKAYRTYREAPAKQPPRPDQGRDAQDPFMDSRPWQVIDPLPVRPRPMPFYEDQLDELLKISLTDLKGPTRSRPSAEKAVQPSIFFPLD